MLWEFGWIANSSMMYTIHSARSRKEYLVLTCGPPSISTTVPKGKDGDYESCSDDDIGEDDENETVCFYAAYSHSINDFPLIYMNKWFGFENDCKMHCLDCRFVWQRQGKDRKLQRDAKEESGY